MALLGLVAVRVPKVPMEILGSLADLVSMEKRENQDVLATAAKASVVLQAYPADPGRRETSANPASLVRTGRKVSPASQAPEANEALVVMMVGPVWTVALVRLERRAIPAFPVGPVVTVHLERKARKVHPDCLARKDSRVANPCVELRQLEIKAKTVCLVS